MEAFFMPTKNEPNQNKSNHQAITNPPSKIDQIKAAVIGNFLTPNAVYTAIAKPLTNLRSAC